MLTIAGGIVLGLLGFSLLFGRSEPTFTRLLPETNCLSNEELVVRVQRAIAEGDHQLAGHLDVALVKRGYYNS
jgi:hypothetical protein